MATALEQLLARRQRQLAQISALAQQGNAGQTTLGAQPSAAPAQPSVIGSLLKQGLQMGATSLLTKNWGNATGAPGASSGGILGNILSGTSTIPSAAGMTYSIPASAGAAASPFANSVAAAQAAQAASGAGAGAGAAGATGGAGAAAGAGGTGASLLGTVGGAISGAASNALAYILSLFA